MTSSVRHTPAHLACSSMVRAAICCVTLADCLMLPDGIELPCPAAPLLAGTVRRSSRAAVLAPVRTARPGAGETPMPGGPSAAGVQGGAPHGTCRRHYGPTPSPGSL